MTSGLYKLTLTSIVILCVPCALQNLCIADEPEPPNEVLVTATPLPATPAELGRSVEILSREDISRLSEDSLPGILETLTSVSVMERGNGAVQGDLSIRGCTFQQVLVTVDGLPATDPQSAHHNMDMPFPVSAMGQITVVPGVGSAVFGPTALGGTVDIATRIPDESGTAFAGITGSFGTRRFDATVDSVRGPFSGTLSSSYAVSDGFEQGTDYETWSVWASSLTGFETASLRISAGHTSKDFGAKDFYAPFPSRESTAMTLIDLAPEMEILPDWRLKTIARYRYHDDEFILKEDDPDYYRNRHETRGFTEKLVLLPPLHWLGATALGVERSDSSLDSSNLGKRDAAVTSMFVQHRIHDNREQRSFDLSVRADRHDNWGTQISPSVSASAAIMNSLRWRASGGRAIRPPDFTELYYNDPGNIGSESLEPEEAWGAETGIDAELPLDLEFSATCFLRKADNLIDWVRASSDDPWEATNIGKTTSQGSEVSISGGTEELGWRVDYRYIDVDAESAGLESKYALNYAKHDIGLVLSSVLKHGFSIAGEARYRDVPTLDSHCLVNARIARQIARVTVFTRGKNLLDEDYEEIPGVPTPGRYLECGVELAW